MFYKRMAKLAVTSALLCAGTAAFAQPAPDGLDTGNREYQNLNQRPRAGWKHDEQLLGKVDKLTRACFSACHGRDKMVQDPSIPNIAGQKYYYVRKQLETFKLNNPDKEPRFGHAWDMWERSNAYMNSITIKVDDRLYDFISDRIARMPCDGERPTTVASPPPTPPRALEGCTSCHGADGMGTAFNVPVIAGQSGLYLRRQLNFMRASEKGSPRTEKQGWRSHPTMDGKIADLADREVRALAAYYAALDCKGAPAP